MWVDFQRINALAPRAKAGDPDAIEQLMEASYPLVDWIIDQRGYYLPTGADGQDLRQDAMIGVMQAIDDWNPGTQPEFSRFARMCAERDLITAVRTANRIMRRAQNEAHSLDVPANLDKQGHHDSDAEDRLARWELPDTSGLSRDPAEVVAEGEALAILSLCYEGLSPLECDVLTHHLIDRRPIKETAAILQRGSKSVDNAAQRVRRKLRERLPGLADDEQFSFETRNLIRLAIESKARRRRCDGPPLAC